MSARSPITGEELFDVPGGGAGGGRGGDRRGGGRAFGTWRDVPAPVRGAFVKRLGELLSEHKADVAELVTIEAGKIRSESLGEVQEAIDICDFAVGLSRQLDGRTMPSERPGHRLMETWHPLGVVGVITAFNFPCAVWAWNAAVAFVCGDTVVWKPSPMTPLTSMACQALVERAASECDAPAAAAAARARRRRQSGQALVDSPDVALVSATGSERMGAEVAPRVAARMGRYLLELGGNNAAIVAPSADLELARRGIVFAAAGTAGQRCTTLRRVIAHEDVVDELVASLSDVFGRLEIGDPDAEGTLVGPLINERAYEGMAAALEEAEADGGELSSAAAGARPTGLPDAFYAEPAIVRMPGQTELVRRETFAPILYVMSYRDLDEAIDLHNGGSSGAVVQHLHRRSARGRAVPLLRRAPTAGSSTSTSAPPAPRSAARSAARSPPAAAASPARTPGAPTCAGQPTRSTTPTSSRWPRESSLGELRRGDPAGPGHRVQRRPRADGRTAAGRSGPCGHAARA